MKNKIYFFVIIAMLMGSSIRADIIDDEYMPFSSPGILKGKIDGELSLEEFESIEVSQASGISFEKFALYTKYVQQHKPESITLDSLAFLASHNFQQVYTYYQNVPEECDKHSVVDAWWKSALLNSDDMSSLIKSYRDSSSVSKGFSEKMIGVLQALGQ